MNLLKVTFFPIIYEFKIQFLYNLTQLLLVYLVYYSYSSYLLRLKKHKIVIFKYYFYESKIFIIDYCFAIY